jgi:hypothetical protein
MKIYPRLWLIGLCFATAEAESGCAKKWRACPLRKLMPK